MNSKLDITWWCPDCDEENEDNFGTTAHPMCETCEHEFDWEDILTDVQFTAYNATLESDLSGRE